MAKVMAESKGIRDSERKEKAVLKKELKAKSKPNQPRIPGAPRVMGIYGGSSKAAKSRRCGECEGCMRDDCGKYRVGHSSS